MRREGDVLKYLLGHCALVVALCGVADAQTSVSWANQRLTVRAVNAPLAELVAEVATRVGMTVIGVNRLQGQRSIDISDLPLAEALPKVLDGVNYLITRYNGAFQIRIHSMSGSGRATPVEKGPLHVPGLTDRRVGEHQQVSETLDFEEVDEDEQEELIGLEEIGKTLAADSLLELLEAMESDFFVVRVRAVQLLAQFKDPRALASILAALGDEDYDVSLAASDTLAEMPGEAVTKALFQQFAPRVEPDVQFGALRALALRADLATIPLLMKSMPVMNPLLHELAADVLGKLEARAKALAKAKGEPGS